MSGLIQLYALTSFATSLLTLPKIQQSLFSPFWDFLAHFCSSVTGQKRTKKEPFQALFKWRRRWDSNPRYARTYDGFQDRSNQPEEVGFEPTVRSHVRRFSRPLQSTALALLRANLSDVILFYLLNIFCQYSFSGLFIPGIFK